jgi:hypothetical protein
LFSSDFKTYFDRLPIIAKHFHSVVALDEFPSSLPVRQFIVVNRSIRLHRGSHWLLIFRSHLDTVEIFNSLGFTNLDDIRPYLKFNFKAHLSYNNTAVQLSTTSSCGLYCIYFAVFRILNLDQPFDEVLDEIFCNDLHTNENKVAQFCQHLLRISDEAELYDF